MGGTGVGAPSAATQESMPELAIAHEYFQYHVRAVANEALKGDSAGAAAGETIAVCNVAEVGKLASAVADGAGGSFVRDGGHGWFLGGIAAHVKNNTTWQGLYRGLLQTFIKALNAEGPEPAHAESSFLYELLAICFCVFDFMQASFSDFHDGVFSSPLLEAKIVKIDKGANGKGHGSMNVPNNFFVGRYERRSTL